MEGDKKGAMERLPKLTAMRLLTAMLTLLFFSGCYNAKKAVRQTNKAILNYRTEIAKITRDVFPCDTSKVTQSENITDTLIEVYCPENDYEIHGTDTVWIQPQTGKKKIPVWVKVPLYHTTITKYVSDNAGEAYLQGKLEKLQTLNEKLNTQSGIDSKWSKWQFIIMGILTVALVVTNLKFFK